jgi:UDP-glucose 4-epimerase
MNALITGGLGFIGSNLTHYLTSRDIDVTILSRSRSKISNLDDIDNDISLITKDITDISEKDVEGFDYIFHCASTVDNYNINDNPTLDFEVNNFGTIALLEAVKNSTTNPRVVFPSTFFVNGNIEKLPATPESPCNPLGLYPISKLAAEQTCKVYNAVFGLDTVIARLTNVYGPREQYDNIKKAAFNSMIKKIMNGEEIPLYENGAVKRDHVYVDDVCSGLLTIAEHGDRGEVYYIGSGEGTTLRSKVETMIDIANTGSTRSIPIPNFHKNVGIGDYWCDNSPLINLGWSPTISMDEGIKKTMEYYKNG